MLNQAVTSGSSDQTLKLWDAEMGECPSTLVGGLGAQQAAIDTETNRILWAGEEAWRILRWRITDPESGERYILPAEHFGPLPTTPILADDNP